MEFNHCWNPSSNREKLIISDYLTLPLPEVWIAMADNETLRLEEEDKMPV